MASRSSYYIKTLKNLNLKSVRKLLKGAIKDASKGDSKAEDVAKDAPSKTAAKVTKAKVAPKEEAQDLEGGISIQIVSPQSFYIKAAKKGELEPIRVLVEEMAEVAASQGHYEIVKMLTNQRTDVDKVLLKATVNNHFQLVKHLLKCGAIPDAWDDNNWTPLMWASFNGNEEIVKYLILKGAVLDVKDDAGRTPLSLAEEKGHKKIVKLLKKEA